MPFTLSRSSSWSGIPVYLTSVSDCRTPGLRPCPLPPPYLSFFLAPVLQPASEGVVTTCRFPLQSWTPMQTSAFCLRLHSSVFPSLSPLHRISEGDLSFCRLGGVCCPWQGGLSDALLLSKENSFPLPRLSPVEVPKGVNESPSFSSGSVAGG